MSNDNETALEALCDLLDCLDAGITQARQTIKKAKGLTPIAQEGTWNPDTIKWETREGAKGPFERSEDVNNLQFKAMLADLAAHNGKLNHNGYFYWTFQNGSTVGRKRK